MLNNYISKTKYKRFAEILTKFYHSKSYICLIGLFVFLSAIFSFEIYIYGLIAVISIFLPALFCEDMTSTIPPLLMCYCSLSLKNNNSVLKISCFNNDSFLIPFIIIASFIALVLMARFIYDTVNNWKNFVVPKLSLGFLILSLSFIIGGVGSSYFVEMNLVISVLEILALCFTYFYLYVSIKWDKLSKDYVLFSFLVLGLVILCQMIGTLIITRNYEYLSGRDKLLIGWGIHTNIGGMIAFTSAAPFYFAIKNKKPYISLCCAFALLAGVILSQSRGPIITALIVFLFCSILLYVKAPKKIKIFHLALSLLVIFLFVFFSLINLSKIKPMFNELSSLFSTSNNLRIETYKDGFKKFIEYPFFGTGWFSSVGNPQFTFVLLPPRWHNTVIQLLATSGIFGLVAYIIHRVQTIKLLFTTEKKVLLDNVILFVCICSLLISSLVDCFFFNLGPGLAYGILLVTMEKCQNDTNLKWFN